MSISIGDLSQQTHVKIPTIRYYERIGLLPIPQRSDKGQRLYFAVDVARLKFVRFGREISLEIGEIRSVIEMISEGNCEELDVMDRFLAERIAALQKFQEGLGATSNAIRQGNLDEIGTLSKLANVSADGGNSACESAEEQESESAPSSKPVTKRNRAKSKL